MYHRVDRERAYISIHALLAESDAVTTVVVGPSSDFYPRSPCGERREPTALRTPHHIFLSTLSLRRATISIVLLLPLTRFLSTLSLRRATTQGFPALHHIFISIHALLAESDVGQKRLRQKLAISIHALLAESDVCSSLFGTSSTISIHALLAESDNGHETSPYKVWISIHALLAESDKRMHLFLSALPDFYPRSPCGERRYCLRHSTQGRHFYPRSPCGERLLVI